MERQTYRVQLPLFEGPLDLLLELIAQQELDITTISLAQVTDQYLAYLRVVEQIRPDDLVDFLVVAARLLVIKSRALLPRPAPVLEEDIGEDLVRQLYEYKRFKEAAGLLQQRNQRGLHVYPRTVPPPTPAGRLAISPDLEGTSLDDLITALQSLLSEGAQDEVQLSVTLDTVTIDQKITLIKELLLAHRQLTFEELLQDASSRMEIVVTLLALLELVRAGRVSLRQERLFGPISVTGKEESVSATDPGTKPTLSSA